MKSEIIQLIDNATNTIISSIDENGFPNIKAMLPFRKRLELKRFYLTTNTSSMRVKHYSNDSKASLYFYNSMTYKGVMFLGHMKVLHDLKSKEMIWHKGDEIYYPKGVNDDDYCVLEFNSEKYRYYHNFKSVDFYFNQE